MQELTLRGLVSAVEVSVVDVESLKVEDSLVHQCTFPVRELLGKQRHQNIFFILAFNGVDPLL